MIITHLKELRLVKHVERVRTATPPAARLRSRDGTSGSECRDVMGGKMDWIAHTVCHLPFADRARLILHDEDRGEKILRGIAAAQVLRMSCPRISLAAPQTVYKRCTRPRSPAGSPVCSLELAQGRPVSSPLSPRPPSLFQVFTPSFDSLIIMSTKKVTNKIKQEVTQGGEQQYTQTWTTKAQTCFYFVDTSCV